MKLTIFTLCACALIFAGCKTDSGAEYNLSPQKKIDAEVDKVTLVVPEKEAMTANQLTADKITAAGFTAPYVMQYVNIAGNAAAQKADITFRLKNGSLHSKERTITIMGFKKPNASPTPQERINAEVDKVTLVVPEKEAMTANQLTADKITAAGFTAPYVMQYVNIAGNAAAQKADITFRLKNGSLHSKERTITIMGFKKPNASPTPQERINAEVDKVTLVVPEKEAMTANQLTADKITAAGFTAPYTVQYVNIARDAAAQKAEITFRLANGSLRSKTRIITITGFKPLAQTYPIAESDVLTAFSLMRGMQSASEAAKKIAAGKGKTVDTYAFTEASAKSYDDEAGTFTVNVKGTKDGKSFDAEITVTDFTHPYASPLQSLVKCKFDLTPAIEENLSLDTYVSRLNAAQSPYLHFEARLENGKNVMLGDAAQYTLTAQVSKDGDGLKAASKYFLKYKKLVAGGAEITEEKMYTVGSLRTQKQAYFTADDVFTHVLTKAGGGDFIKVSSDEFASSFCTLARNTGTTPDGLLDMTKIQKYIDVYKTKDANEHLAVKLSAGLYNAKNGGISANDTEGTLTLQYCITTEEELEKHVNGQSAHITAISEQITKTGFKKADKDTLKKLFEFKILKASNGSGEPKTEWKKYQIGNGYIGSPLVKAEGNKYKAYKFPLTAGKPFCLTINDSENPADVFALSAKSGLSKIAGDKYILITHLTLSKNMGEEKMTAAFTLVDGSTVSVEYSPSFQ